MICCDLAWEAPPPASFYRQGSYCTPPPLPSPPKPPKRKNKGKSRRKAKKNKSRN